MGDALHWSDVTDAGIARPCPRQGCREQRAMGRRLLRIELVLWLALALELFGETARRLLLPLIGG